MKDWDAVVAFALALPDAETGTSYGAPAVKLNGKSFVTRSREADSFHVMSPHDEKAVLIETDPDTFWQTAHYANWPGLLVRFASTDPDRVRTVITRAWWDRANKAQRKAFGDRPNRFRHFAAVDWSGAIGARQRGIAVALCATGDNVPELLRPDHIWSRAEVRDWLLDDLPPDTLVGLDLGASLPFVDCGAFFPGWTDSPPDARSLWHLIDRICTADAHLAAGSFVDHVEAARHFRRHGGRQGDRFEPGRGRLRETERAQQRMGLNPYSNLNLVGAAQVGKSSLTGMRVLAALDGKLPIWPFDPLPAAGSVVAEIYTTIAALAAGRTKNRSKMRSWEELDAALTHPAIASRPSGRIGTVDDHATDAVLTAAWLRRAAGAPALWTPAALTDELARTEGWTFGAP